MVDPNAIVKLAEQAASAINGMIQRLPSREQKQLDAFFEFQDKYNEEITRNDSDFDDLMAWRERRLLLLETIIQKITRPGKK